MNYKILYVNHYWLIIIFIVTILDCCKIFLVIRHLICVALMYDRFCSSKTIRVVIHLILAMQFNLQKIAYVIELLKKRVIFIVIGLVISNCCLLALMMVTIWCTYDAAGRSWVKMKKYQRSMREAESRATRLHYKRSGSRNRNWRQR